MQNYYSGTLYYYMNTLTHSHCLVKLPHLYSWKHSEIRRKAFNGNKMGWNQSQQWYQVPTGICYYKTNNSDVLLHTLQHVKLVFEAYLGVSNTTTNNNNNSVILFNRTGIIRHSLCQHPVESVLHAWQEGPGNWNSHFNYSDRVQNTVKVAEGWKILQQQCMLLGIIRSYL